MGVFLLVALAAPAVAGPNTVLVGVERAGDDAVLRSVVTAAGGVVRECHRRARFCVVELPSPPSPAMVQQWSALPGVRYAEVDRPMVLAEQAAPADALGTGDCTDLWELDEVRAEAGWDHASSAPVVAVADGGFRQSHEELQGLVAGQFDYGNLDAFAELEWDVGVPAHGTFIGAVVAGIGDNGAGRTGLVPGGSLNLLKIADSSGAFYFSYAAAALADVADGDLGIGVVNYSLASSSSSQAFQDAVASLAEVDVVLVAAAGNCAYADCADADNDAFPLYPASLVDEHLLVVAGSTQGGGVNRYSHFGAHSVDLAAPGVDICSADVDADDDYATAGGTSYAAPLVAGAAALVMGVHPDLTAVEVVRVVRASAAAAPEWEGLTRSGGVLDVAAALGTAVPRLSVPGAPVVVDSTGSLELEVLNVGAAGDGWVWIEHGPGVSVTDVDLEGWSVATYGPGDPVYLPDAGEVEVVGSGALAGGPLPEHGVATVRLGLRGEQVGADPATVRVVATSGGAAYLNAPYDDGEADGTGFLALPVTLEVTAAASDADTGDTAADTDTAALDTGGAAAQPGCGCASGPAAPGMALVWALAGWRRRRGAVRSCA